MDEVGHSCREWKQVSYLLIKAPEISVLPHATENLRCCLYHFRRVSVREREKRKQASRVKYDLTVINGHMVSTVIHYFQSLSVVSMQMITDIENKAI